jgi:curved DNA-binding protein CbpA
MAEQDETLIDIAPGEDPYAVLALARDADDAAIKRAYFQRVRKYPPEQNPEQFQQIRRAYEQLRDPEQRSLIGLFLLQEPPKRPRRRLPKRDLDVHVEDLMALAAVLSARPIEADTADLERII